MAKSGFPLTPITESASCAKGVGGQLTVRNTNELGQLTGEYEQAGGANQVMHEYDTRGLRTQVQITNALRRTVKYTYDANQRISTITDAENKLTTLTYDAVSRPSTISYPDGTVETRSYDARDRITEIKVEKGAVVLSKIGYTYNLASERITETWVTPGKTRMVNYQYDVLSRLTQAQITESGANLTLAWTYDAVGNRLTETTTNTPTGGTATTSVRTYNYDDNDRLLSERTDAATPEMVNYSYDDSGNLLRKLTSMGVAPTLQVIDEIKYNWDSEDRLTSVTEAAHTASPQTTTYVYNGFGERIEEVAPGTAPLNNRTTRYGFDHTYGHAQVIEERNGSGALYAHHTVTPFPNAQSALRISEVRGDVGTGDAIANSQYRVYHQDALASTRMLTDQSGVGTDFVSYLPFGKPSGRTGTSGTRFLFTGEQQGVAGLTYLRARHLDVGQGRFLGMDSWEGFDWAPASLHKFVNSQNNAVNRVDPSGHMGLLDVSFGMSAGIALGLGVQTVFGGAYNTYSGPNGRPTHHYETKRTKICSLSPECTPEKVYKIMLRMPAPAHINPDLGSELVDGQLGYAGWLIFPGGPVVFRRNDSQLTHVNQTLWYHILHNGHITRTAMYGEGGVTIKTVGEGDNHTAFIAWANERAGKQIFEQLDYLIRAWIRTNGTH